MGDTTLHFQPVAEPHAEALVRELDWLAKAIDARIAAFLQGDAAARLPKPPAVLSGSHLSELVTRERLEPDARLVLALAVAAQVAPEMLDPFCLRNPVLDRTFTEFGGMTGAGHAFLPTGETALFLLCGTDLAARLDAARLFDPDHTLRRSGILTLDPVKGGTPALSALFGISAEHLSLLASGRARKPDHSPDFPAQRLTTALSWADLVLAPEIADQLEHITAWLANESRILGEWGLARSLAPGYRCLFYGPPGTGKTLSAALLGQRAGLDVYRIDLSMMVSKYIGETEKNLANVFDLAAHRNWILFFDEADALFGARTSVSSSNDRHANQEVAYLLQRIETCPSLVILATNLRSSIDDAFVRRFQSLVGFARPDAAQRLRLWQGVTSGGMPLAKDVNLGVLARDYDLVGGAIINVVRHAAITALRAGRSSVSQADLVHGIGSEMRKEGRTV